MTARKSAKVSSSTDPLRSTPALLTSTSMWPASLWISAIAVFTELSESTSITEILTGSPSCAAFSPSSGAREGLRIVAYTLWPARPRVSAVARPIPVLVPVMSTDAMVCSPSFAVVDGRPQCTPAATATTWSEITVAVGTTITDRPPHRSVRARLRIRLLTRMSGGKVCLPHTEQSLGHAFPALCRAHVRLNDVLLSLCPSLPGLRRRLPFLVRLVHGYYGTVRLLLYVHVRRSVYGLRGPVLIG